MTIFSTILNRVISYPAMYSLIRDRIGQPPKPQELELPAITFYSYSEIVVQSKDGASGLVAPTYRFIIWSHSEVEAKVVGAVLLKCLISWKQKLPGLEIQNVIHRASFEIWEPIEEIYQSVMDYQFWFYEG